MSALTAVAAWAGHAQGALAVLGLPLLAPGRDPAVCSLVCFMVFSYFGNATCKTKAPTRKKPILVQGKCTPWGHYRRIISSGDSCLLNSGFCDFALMNKYNLLNFLLFLESSYGWSGRVSITVGSACPVPMDSPGLAPVGFMNSVSLSLDFMIFAPMQNKVNTDSAQGWFHLCLNQN